MILRCLIASAALLVSGTALASGPPKPGKCSISEPGTDTSCPGGGAAVLAAGVAFALLRRDRRAARRGSR